MSENDRTYNLIITGVGGQGNVLASQLVGQAFVSKGWFATIGETYGASQRGGPVMSHIRISEKKQRSPLIPQGKADIIMALEPVEALRVMAPYGNADVTVIVNTRSIFPVEVTAGDENYPEMEEIQSVLNRLSKKAYFINAVEMAIQMGLPILSNMIMMGALLSLNLLPLSVEEFADVLSKNLAHKHLEINMKALAEGAQAIA
ncbi:indolepyruvate oxidoreductase subunit beta [Thermodesulfobacteriota bacterium]